MNNKQLAEEIKRSINTFKDVVNDRFDKIENRLDNLDNKKPLTVIRKEVIK